MVYSLINYDRTLSISGYADSVAVSGEGEAQVVRVFYATDREPTGSTDPDEFFGGEYGDLSYGRVEVSILPGHRVGELERPSILRFEFREDPDKHVVLASIEALDEARFYRELADSLTVAEEREALVFIHGYNVSFDRAARRTAQLATPGFPGRARSLQLALGRRAPSIRRR